jgi:WD40 repeat protein
MRLLVGFPLLVGLTLFLRIQAANPTPTVAHALPTPNLLQRTDTFGDPLPDGAIARLGTMRLQHDKTWQVHAAVFSPNGKVIASRSWPHDDLRLWNAATGKQLHQFALVSAFTTTRVRALAFSPDGAILAAGSAHDIILWDVVTGKTLQTLSGPSAEVLDILFIDNGRTLLSAGVDGAIRWWDRSTGKQQRVLKPFADGQQANESEDKKTKGFLTAAFAPDGKALAVQPGWYIKESLRQHDNQAVVFDLTSGKPLWQVKSNSNLYVQFAFAPDSKRLAVHLDDGDVHVRDAATGKKLAVAPLPANKFEWRWVGRLAFSPDGKVVAISAGALNVGLWNLDDNKLRVLTARIAGQSSDPGIGWLTFSPDSKQLLIAVNSDVQLVQVASGAESLAWPGHRSPVTYVGFSADGKHLVSGGAQDRLHPNEVVTWDVKSWKQTQRSTLVTGKFAHIRTASPTHAVGIGWDGANFYALFDMTTGKPLGCLIDVDKNHHRYNAYFSPGGQFLFVWNEIQGKKVAEVFAVSTGKLLWRLPWLKGTFSIDERQLAFFSADGSIQVYDTATGKLLWQLGTKSPGWDQYYHSTGLTFSTDGKLLASCSDYDIQVWDLTTGKKRYRLPGIHSAKEIGRPVSLALSPDGRMLAVSGVSGEAKIQLWELASCKVRAELVGHQGTVRCLAFSLDSRLLASGSEDTTVLVWDMVEPAKLPK